MSFIAAGAAIISAGVAIAKMVQSSKQEKQARLDEAKAKQEMDKQKDAFASMDTTNPYLNMENTMEDLTVNKQQAEFQQQQQMQSQANIMQQMRGAAGGSGIAALAQTMAQQGSMDAQRASASIGQQESRNQMLQAQEASRIQGLEREGEGIKRNQQFGKISGMMGMASGDLEGARSRIQSAQEQNMAATKDMATTATDLGENYGWYDGKLQRDYQAGDSGLYG